MNLYLEKKTPLLAEAEEQSINAYLRENLEAALFEITTRFYGFEPGFNEPPPPTPRTAANKCPATMGLPCNYEDGVCSLCGEKQAGSEDFTATGGGACVATMGLPCIYVDGVCTVCNLPQDRPMTAATCVATMGVPCNYVEGVCTACGESVVSNAMVVSPSPSMMATQESCPGTMGLPHEYGDDDKCSTCGEAK